MTAPSPHHHRSFAVGLALLAGCILVTLLAGQVRQALAQDGDHAAPAPAAVEHPDEATSPAIEHADHDQAAHGNASHGDSHDDAHGDGHGHAKVDVNPIWMLPFAALLGCIALMPLLASHMWHHHYPKFAGVFFLIGLVYYWFIQGDMHPWVHEMKEYVSFIALLFALFVISGGIVINVSRKATPVANCTLLLLGAIIANIFGTTGAAMLLIRPYIRINRAHIKPYHIVFFIFIVANVGGCLTPIGDPPLFLGYLKGVPFWWVIENCWQPWAVATLLLLVMFFILDTRDHKNEERSEPEEHDTGPGVRINGIHNFLFITVVLVGVFRPSVFEAWEVVSGAVTGGAILDLLLSREVIMVAAALVSKLVTFKGIYERNEFTWEPIREVAILFVAIFSTMVPALQWLDANAEKMPTKTPGQFYFVTGALSSVLDNAPTYLTFLQTELGRVKQDYAEELAAVEKEVERMAEAGSTTIPIESTDPLVIRDVETIRHYHGVKAAAGKLTDTEMEIDVMISHPEIVPFLVAISIGAVFFGAMTYIGNAPNFMVKSIAESAGIKMPSFLGYVFRYSLIYLLPVLVVIWVIFFALKPMLM